MLGYCYSATGFLDSAVKLFTAANFTSCAGVRHNLPSSPENGDEQAVTDLWKKSLGGVADRQEGRGAAGTNM